ncbi:MAG: hypothetical protein GY766_25030, partial [Herbaspirillum sp.]|uniref:Calx-beta domain-containing protein n=1 Tax=Herbaspirillum sp. TaxID=1890675 RepID=UPI0025889B55
FTVAMGGDVPLTGDNLAYIDVTRAGGSASDGSDYDPTIEQAISDAATSDGSVSFDGTTLTFSAGGSTSLDFTVTADDDETVEGSETFDVTLTSAGVDHGSASINDGDETVTIVEDDADVSFDLSASTNTIDEDTEESTVFTVAMGGDVPLTGDNLAYIDVTRAGGSASDGSDYDPTIEQAISDAAT